jgi:hypothetical protein
MRTVEISMPPRELSQQMAAMRSWLDAHRYEATTFACDETASDMRVCITFGSASAAIEFAQRFSGRLRQAAAQAAFEEPESIATDLVG